MMDRSGKERLIGAGILVALAVAVVPELLSGPKPVAPMAESVRLPVGAPDPVRNVTMDLATSKPTDPASTAPASTAPASTAPATSTSASLASPPSDLVAAAPETHIDAPVQAVPMQAVPMQAVPVQAVPMQAAPTLAAAQGRPDNRSATAVPAAGSGAGFSVQLGSFANRSNAETLVHQLKAQGYAVYESTEGTGKNARYRVRVGPFSDRDSAERSMVKLKASGHASTLIGSH